MTSLKSQKKPYRIKKIIKRKKKDFGNNIKKKKEEEETLSSKKEEETLQVIEFRLSHIDIHSLFNTVDTVT